MADSYLDTAGGMQQVPDVNVVEKPEQPYTATDGSMQSALAVNVLSGGIPANGVPLVEGETVDVLSSDGSTQLAQGTADIDTSTDPNTLNGIDLAANLAVLADGASIPVQETDGTAIGNGTLHVAANQETHFTYDGGGSGTALADGDPVNFDSADGTTILATGTASVTGGNLVGVLAPATVAVVNDAGTVPLTNDTGSARGNVNASVAANVLTLALPTQADVVTDGASAPVLNAAGDTTLATASAKVPISVFDGLKLAATDAVTADAATVSLQDTGGNALDSGTAAVATNALTVTVPDSITGGGGGPAPGADVGVWNAANNDRMFIGTANYDTGPLKILAPGTVATLNDSGLVSLQNNAGTARGTLNVSVSGNNGILSFPAQSDRVNDGDHVRLNYSNGDDTGETLAVKVPGAALEAVQIDQAFTIVKALGWVTVTTSDGSKSAQGLVSLTADGRLDNAALGASDTVASAGDAVNAKDGHGTTVAGTLNLNANGVADNVEMVGTATIIENGGSVTVQNMDGSIQADADATVTEGNLNFASFQGTTTLVNQGLNVTVANSDASNPKPALAQVGGGLFSGVNLANDTDAVVSDGFTCPATGSGSTATIHVSAGGDISVTLS
ncbi:beta strand repeat-containing protein [Nitratireductor sp. GCM10026969]|uniref:beta strand repeat-containing protein n=1 Tax=Nitratireductor sp. GCM10026969 TaxID=3252645 RepID=UPI00361B50C8